MENSQLVTTCEEQELAVDMYLSAITWIDKKEYGRATRLLHTIKNGPLAKWIDRDVMNNTLGAIYMKLKNYHRATLYFLSAKSIRPLEQYYRNAAQSLMLERNPSHALELCKEFIGMSDGSDNLDQIYLCAHAAAYLMKDFGQADRLLGMAGDSAESKALMGMRLMARRSEWNKGVELYGARKVMYDPYIPSKAKAMFINAADIRSSSWVNVVLEQGLGDCIMMIPYILRLSEEFGINTCVVSIDGRHDSFIDDIMSSYDSVSTKKIPASLLPSQLGDLVWMFDLLGMEDKIIGHNGYIAVNKQIKDLAWWSDGMIGICWRGNPVHNNDSFRSMGISDLGPILRLPKVLSIQADLTELEKNVLIDHGVNHWDNKGLMSLAGVMSNLKAVVTVDTAVSHIAGALGVKCYTMLPTNADWRWGDFDSIHESDLYPKTHTLIRQVKCGDWSHVVDYICHSVTSFNEVK